MTLQPVATLPRHYASASECSVQTSDVLAENANFDFPSLMAECRPGAARRAADKAAPTVPARAASRSTALQISE